MFTQQWSTSERKYDVIVERDCQSVHADGTLLDGNIYRPLSYERFPVILGAHAYNKNLQSPPMRPVGFTPIRGYMGKRRLDVLRAPRLRARGLQRARQRQLRRLLPTHGAAGSARRSCPDRLAGGAALEQRRGRDVRRLLLCPARQGSRGVGTDTVKSDFFSLRRHRRLPPPLLPRRHTSPMALSATGATACTVPITAACTKRPMARPPTKRPSPKRCATTRSQRSRGCAKRCRIRTPEPTH